MVNSNAGRTGLQADRRYPSAWLSGLAFLSVATVLCLGSPRAMGQAAGGDIQTTALKVGEVRETLPLPKAGGATVTLDVVIADWRFEPGNTVMQLTSAGPVILTVTNGRIAAAADGSTKTYNAGDYWTVPAGTRLAISVGPPFHGAMLRTIAATGS